MIHAMVGTVPDMTIVRSAATADSAAVVRVQTPAQTANASKTQAATDIQWGDAPLYSRLSVDSETDALNSSSATPVDPAGKIKKVFFIDVC